LGGGQVTLNIPPFRGVVKTIIIVCIAVFIVQSLLQGIYPKFYEQHFFDVALVPNLVVHRFFIWQLVTYIFLHADTSHILFNMLALWMFGSQMEVYWGSRHFTVFFFASAVGGALLTVLMAMFSPFGGANNPCIGESGAGMGILVAYALTFGNNMIYLIPLPFPIKAKYLVAVFMAINILGAIRGEGGIAYFVHIGGAITAYMMVRFSPRRGYGYAGSEKFYGSRNTLRNWFERWKRRRAAKKFEVFMRDIDSEKHFDDEGKLRDPKDGNGKGGPGSWVN